MDQLRLRALTCDIQSTLVFEQSSAMRRPTAVFAFVLMASSHFGQASKADESANTREKPQRIATVDLHWLGEVYTKLNAAECKQLQDEISETDTAARGLRDRIQEIQERMKKTQGGSAKCIEDERQLIKVKAELDAFVASVRKPIQKQESAMTRKKVLAVFFAVRQEAEVQGYTMVLNHYVPLQERGEDRYESLSRARNDFFRLRANIAEVRYDDVDIRPQ